MSKSLISRRSFFMSAPFAAAGVVAATKVGAVENILQDPSDRASYHYHEMSKALSDLAELHGANHWTLNGGFTSFNDGVLRSNGLRVMYSGKIVEHVNGKPYSYQKDLAAYDIGINGEHNMVWGNESLRLTRLGASS